MQILEQTFPFHDVMKKPNFFIFSLLHLVPFLAWPIEIDFKC